MSAAVRPRSRRQRTRTPAHGGPAAGSASPSPELATPAGATPQNRWAPLIIALLLAGATLAAYRPAWFGAPLWDDDAHLTRVELQSGAGLQRIWTDLGATQQYYPVAHTAFWLMHRVFGDATFGYHLTNILLHAASAWLLGLLLRRLAVPGAWIAATIFALHPVHVESVAWLSELKNTLSGVFYFSSALIYLRFDRDRRAGLYLAALVLFVVAVLTKTVTASLPAALLVVFWWQRGRLDVRRDLVPLTPFLAAGLALGLLTAYVEHAFIGAQGAEFQLGLAERFLLAGRIVWFYLLKLVWPSPLMFIYPKWTINASDGLAYVFPLLTLAAVAGAWWWRTRSRTPLTIALLFGGTLVPALGFVNVYPFRYSYVADHFQYLASAPVIAGVAAGLSVLLARMFAGGAAVTMLWAAVSIPLAVLTWRQAGQYTDVETLYQETLRRNPGCWLCLNNLGQSRLAATPPDVTTALRYFDEALRLYPGNAEAHNNRGVAFSRLGRFEEARQEHETATRLSPGDPDAHNNLGTALERLNDRPGALREYREAVRLRPRFALAHYNAGGILTKFGQFDEALAHLETATALAPDDADALDALGTVRLRRRELPAAVEAYQRAIKARPSFGEAHSNLGMAFELLNRVADARGEYERAAALLPTDGQPHDNLGYLLFRAGDRTGAEAQFREAIRLTPTLASAHVNLGNLLLDQGALAEAITEYRAALAAGAETAQTHNNLGVALAQSGRRAEAAAEFTTALRLQPEFEDARRNLARATGR